LNLQFSCLLTCHNERQYIGEAIASVRAQTLYSNVSEVIVVDDGSTDGSGEFLDEIAKSDARFKVHHIANRGLSGARNYGLKRALAPFVALLDGDDLWHPQKLARQAAVIERGGDKTGLWYTDFLDFVDSPENGTFIPVRRYQEDQQNILESYFIFDAPIVPSTVVLRRSMLEKTGLFDEEVRLFEDTEMWLRIAESGFAFQHVPGGLLFKRRRADSLSGFTKKWASAMDLITERWAHKHESLRSVAHRRQSVRLSKIAQRFFSAGDHDAGWNCVREAIKAHPTNPRPYVYGALALLPWTMREFLLSRRRRASRDPLGADKSLGR
jgi:glycosyltransferase involved in cell wall biosynthesis